MDSSTTQETESTIESDPSSEEETVTSEVYDAGTTETGDEEVTEDITTELVKENPYRYRHYYWDRKTQFYYLQARYYNPRLGRFISMDPWRGEMTHPLSLNRYVYSFNNPTNYWDPTGMITFVLGGINNEDYPKNDDASYILKEKIIDRTVVVVDSAAYTDSLIVGAFTALNESFDKDNKLSDATISYINDYLANYTFAEGEKLNLVGYSGGGVLVVKAGMKLNYEVDNVFALGTPLQLIPFSGSLSNIGKIHLAYSYSDTVQIGAAYGMYHPASKLYDLNIPRKALGRRIGQALTFGYNTELFSGVSHGEWYSKSKVINWINNEIDYNNEKEYDIPDFGLNSL